MRELENAFGAQMEIREGDWRRLAELRAEFLGAGDEEASSALADYWSEPRDLALYDATFAQRIGWKWLTVSNELALRKIVPPRGTVLDWGCGTGIASRRFIEHFASSVERVVLWDRSRAACEFASNALKQRHPDIDVEIASDPSQMEPDILLASHVVSELSEESLAELLALARRSRFFAWVEAGNRDTSRKLSQARDYLLDVFEVLAPCTHQATCGMLAPGNETNWCHHFARPPVDVFQSKHWATFSKQLGLDLRALPYSFLVMQHRVGAATEESTARILGRPRIGKGHALLDVCDRSGVLEMRILQRTAPALFKRWKHGPDELPIYRARTEGSRIVDIESAFDTGGGPLSAH